MMKIRINCGATKQKSGQQEKHSENEQNCEVCKKMIMIMIIIIMTMFKQNYQKVSLKCVNTNLNARISHTCFKSLTIPIFGIRK